jgi:hypothetical protein
MKRMWHIIPVIAVLAMHEGGRGPALLAQVAGGGTNHALDLCTGKADPSALEYPQPRGRGMRYCG